MAIIRAEQITIFITDDDPVIARMAAAVDVVEAAGVTFEAADDVADNATAALVAITASGTGHLRNYRTTPLLTVEETLGIMRKAGDITKKSP